MTVDIKTCILYTIHYNARRQHVVRAFWSSSHIKSSTSNWACNVNLTDPCRYAYASPMAQIALCPNDALRQQWSQRALDNTYIHVPLADTIRGISGAKPVGTTHAFCKGVIEVVIFLVLDKVPKRQEAALDRPVGSSVSQIALSVILRGLPFDGF